MNMPVDDIEDVGVSVEAPPPQPLVLDAMLRAAYLLGQGANAREIANHLGTSERAVSYSLGLYNFKVPTHRRASRMVQVYVSKQRLQALEKAARARDIEWHDVLTRLIHTATKPSPNAPDGIIDAILDDGITSGGRRK